MANTFNPSQYLTPQGTPSDPSVVALAQSIREEESGGNYTQSGDAGTSLGAYQWNNGATPIAQGQLPQNFVNAAKQYGLDPTDFSEQNQNKVAYLQMAQMKSEGMQPYQIASSWNSGSPDNWKTGAHQGTTTINGQSVSYDTPKYVQNVMANYQKYATQMGVTPGAGATPQSGTPSMVAGDMVPAGSSGSPSGAGVGTGTSQAAYGYVQPPTQAPTNDAMATASAGTGTSYAFGGSGTPGSPGTAVNPNEPDPGQASFANAAYNLGQLPSALGQLGGDLLPILPDIYNDIQGKSDKTVLQQVGDAGMSAAWFLPFGDIAEGIGLGAEALGLGADAAKTAGVLGTGVGTGYLGGAASNLSQGQSLPSAFSPNSGTLTGAALGGGFSAAGLAAGGLYNKFLGQQSAVDKVQSIWQDAAGSTKSGITNMSKTAAKGLTANPEFLANAGILPETSEVNDRLVFNTGEDSAAQKTLTQRIGALSELRDAAVAKSGATVNLEDLRGSMLTQAQKTFSGTALNTATDQINSEVDALAADPKYAVDQDGNISAGNATKIKSYLQGRANYDRPTQGLSASVFDTMANATKSTVEDAATEAGAPSIGDLNKMIQQHYDAQKFLSKINGQTIKGGRLGTYVKEGIGAAVGGAVGSAVGGGPIGTGLGILAGYKGGELASNFMQKLAAGGPMTAATFGRMATEDPEIVQQFAEYLGGEGGKVAPIVKPVETSAATKVTSLIKKSPGNVFRGMSRKAATNVFGAAVR